VSEALTALSERLILAVDLGTQRLKVAAVSAREWRIVAQRSCSIPYASTEDGMFEQDPEAWWGAFAGLVRALIGDGELDPRRISAIGLSGHMHSLVLVDEQGRPTRPAIAWADARSHAYGAAVLDASDDSLWNPAIAPYTATKLLWLKHHDPAPLAAARHLLFPKDYLRFKLTGRFATDPSDASSSLLWDFDAGAWDVRLVAALGLDEALFPAALASTAVGGHVTDVASGQTGLPEGAIVAIGSGDVAAALNGHASSDASGVLINAGTAAQIITSSIQPERFVPGDPARFMFERGSPTGAFAMGALPSAGLSLTWWSQVIENPGGVEALGEGIDLDVGAGAPPYFLPFLQGTGTPMLRDQAAGAFLPLSSASSRESMTRAVMEGIAYGIRLSLEALDHRADADIVSVTGGLARSSAMRRMITNVLGRAVQFQDQADVSLVGAAAYGAVACGAASTTTQVASAMAGGTERVDPEDVLTSKYKQGFEAFHALSAHVLSWTPSATLD